MTDACYGCLHRRALPGSAHSACHHPRTAYAHRSPLAALITAKGDALPVDVPGLDVAFEPRGIERGWAAWPYRYDPVWLVACDGYDPVAED